jgi:tRNA (guanine10-N2)-methyltransferase
VGRKISLEEQVAIVESFKSLPFKQELVDLDEFEQCFKVLEVQEENKTDIYFGYIVANSRWHPRRDETFHQKYDLKKRPYLGPTSTDHELAFLMANQGMVRAGDYAYDPFVGTGSIATAL